ncbi:MAG: ribbon-helix-helix protein, CopG family [Alphaproteobacteria bacterium]|nr:MAG: ribbon-helix-helix protein, CopG family [Alphaproteobacteria bacterium]
MPRISIRVDDELHDRLRVRARAAGLTTSELVRPVLEDIAWPGGRYVYTANDEILTIAIQILALLAQDLTTRSPADYARGLEAARGLLRNRGLLAAENDPLQGPAARPSGEARRP